MSLKILREILYIFHSCTKKKPRDMAVQITDLKNLFTAVVGKTKKSKEFTKNRKSTKKIGRARKKLEERTEKVEEQ